MTQTTSFAMAVIDGAAGGNAGWAIGTLAQIGDAGIGAGRPIASIAQYGDGLEVGDGLMAWAAMARAVGVDH